MWEHDRNPVLSVPPPNRLGKFHLLNQFRHEGSRQGNHPVFAALGPDKKEIGLLQVNVFDAQIEGLADAQAATINQATDQVGGITRPIPNAL